MKAANILLTCLANIVAAFPRPAANGQSSSPSNGPSSSTASLELSTKFSTTTAYSTTTSCNANHKSCSSKVFSFTKTIPISTVAYYISTVYTTTTIYPATTICSQDKSNNKKCATSTLPAKTSTIPVSTVTVTVEQSPAPAVSVSTVYSTSTVYTTSTSCNGRACSVVTKPIITSVLPVSTVTLTFTSTSTTEITSGSLATPSASTSSRTSTGSSSTSITASSISTSASSNSAISYSTTETSSSTAGASSSTFGISTSISQTSASEASSPMASASSSTSTAGDSSSSVSGYSASSTTASSSSESGSNSSSTAASSSATTSIASSSILSSTASLSIVSAFNTTSTTPTSTGATNSSSTTSSTSSTGTPCAGNTASDRSVWCDYDTSTDYYNVVPDTGIIREYWFELTDITIAPDGVSRPAMAVNGSIPGPTIIANWGDEVIVHVINSLTGSNNGSSIHFHGIRQNYTNQADGVTSVTQCPTAPGDTETYKWRATQYGSSWYHSHFALQAWEGVFGGIVINGPATANYDVDLGNLMMQDWSHQTADELYVTAEIQGPVTLDTGLINGTNVFGEDGDTNQTGTRFSTTFESGSSYLLRLVNVAIDTQFKFSIDNHTMTVIASDFVPITPYTTTVISIGMGQRYDVIITADQASVASDFWMRAIPQISCSDNDSVDNIKGIVHYGSSTGTPTTSGYTYTDECLDETNLVPFVSKTVGSVTVEADNAVGLAQSTDNYIRWTLNGTSMLIDWENPTLLQVYNNQSASSFSNTSNLISVPNANEWVYVVITEVALPVTHPIHLHGHDFFVLASGTGTYNSSTVSLNLSNPPRRDVALLPSAGYLVLAFETDNPGAWLMHCHIGWHTLEGFALQFLERESEIWSNDLIDYDSLNATCSNWNAFTSADSIVQTDDSGI